MFDELRRVALFTSGVAELTRHQAERLVKDMVEKGDIRRKQASDAVRELVSTSKQSREMLVEMVRAEIRRQIAQLGVPNKRDLERLERRVARLEGRSGAKKTTSKAKATRATAGPKRAGATSTPKDSPGKKTTRKVPPRKSSPSGTPRISTPSPSSTPPIARPIPDEGAGDTASSDPSSS